MTFDTFVEIFTDGGCKRNPGPGGWGVLLRHGKITKTLSGSERQTTNNRMEMTAAIKGLEALKCPCHVRLTTDSMYLKNGITSWVKGWKKNGWKTRDGASVLNIDLWQKLDILTALHRVEWHWVKGHAGHHENELVDELANKAIQAMLIPDCIGKVGSFLFLPSLRGGHLM